MGLPQRSSPAHQQEQGWESPLVATSKVAVALQFKSQDDKTDSPALHLACSQTGPTFPYGVNSFVCTSSTLGFLRAASD